MFSNMINNIFVSYILTETQYVNVCVLILLPSADSSCYVLQCLHFETLPQKTQQIDSDL